MSDVIVSTTESTTNVTTTNDVTTIAITDTVVEVSQATAGLQGPPGSNSDPTYVYVTNKTGAQLNKGAIVYVSGANGTHTQVSLAIATGDVTSARTLGWLVDDIANNATGLCCISGYLDGVNTQGVTEGAQLYLSPTTAGGFTATKPGAPDHMVYVGICAKASAGNGRVFVHIQNGAELEELHDVKIVSPQNNDLLRYVSGTALWENVAATAITVGSAILSGTAVFASTASTASNAGTASYATNAGTSVYSTTSGTAVSISGTITRSQVSDYASGTVANITGSITRSQVSNFASGTVAVATVSAYADESGTALFATNANYATTSGTAVFATNASTAVYATTSGTSVTISGTITTSQVSDFASGTVANISGTVTQSQVSNLTTDLAGKANLVGGNSFTGAQVIATAGTANIGLVVQGTASQSANLTEWQNNTGGTVAFVSSAGLFTPAAIRQTTAGNLNSFGGAAVSGQIVSIFTGGTANKGLVIQGVLNQSANLFEIQTSTGSTAVRINQVGNTTFNGNITSQNNATFTPASTATVPLTVQGLASQTSSYFEVQNSAAATLFRVNSSGFSVAPLGFIAGGAAQASGANNTLYSTGTASVGLVVRGIASQSANLQEWQNSSGGTAARVDASGNIETTGIGITRGDHRVGTGSYYSAALNVLARSTTEKGVVVRGQASQSANLQEWQNSGGTVLASIDSVGALSVSSGNATITSGGVIRGVQVATNNDYVSLRQENAGGFVRLTRGTAAVTNPGANLGALYFRDGTNAGTLKLVVRAGAAGAETTILDNIPT